MAAARPPSSASISASGAEDGDGAVARHLSEGAAGGPGAWPPQHGRAWIGLLETHKRLTRALDGELDARHGLNLSSLELLARLVAAPHRCLRLSALAAETGLSLSRISRIAVLLERRGLLDRRPCPQDARAVDAHLTPDGLALLRGAQETYAGLVRWLFLDALTETELEVLAEVFGRLGRVAP